MWPRAPLPILCAIILFPQVPASQPPSLQFHDADADPGTGELLFDPFESVDWKRLAHAELQELNPFDPTPVQFEQLKKHYAEHANLEGIGGDELKVSSPLPPSMKAGSYYALSTRGILPLQLVRLNVSVIFTLNKNQTAIRKREFYGKVVASTPGLDAGDVGFILHSESGPPVATPAEGRFTAQKIDKQDVYRYEAGGKTWNLSIPDEGLFEMMTATSFKIGTTTYLFVKWKPDTANNYAGCDRQFSLFTVDQELRVLASNRSGCDV
jgi:hypothetical protein